LKTCETASADCFTAGQIAALERMYSDVTAAGKRVFPGWPYGAEEGWVNWMAKDSGPTIGLQFSSDFFKYLLKPGMDWKDFQLDRDLPKLDAIHKVLDATDPDLSAFRERGGKMLMYYGWADPALNARMGVEYYESVLKQMGPNTTDFFRLFLVPGMFHCGGGPGPNQFDSFGALRDWVEKGTKPDVLQAKKGNRTRPLCVYPQVARYSGSGSIDDAASFRCVAP
jgi:feruloyl esterase